MRKEEVVEKAYHKLPNKDADYGILPPPMDYKTAFEILKEHFLGDYISVNPISNSQYITEVVYRIVADNPGIDEKKKLTNLPKEVVAQLTNLFRR